MCMHSLCLCAPAEECAVSLIALDLVHFQYKGAEILVHMLFCQSSKRP